MSLPGISVPYGCPNKLPQAGWLKTTEIRSLPGLEAEFSAEDPAWAVFLLEALRQNLFLVCSSFRWSVASSLQLHGHLSLCPVFLWPFSCVSALSSFAFLLYGWH